MSLQPEKSYNKKTIYEMSGNEYALIRYKI